VYEEPRTDMAKTSSWHARLPRSWRWIGPLALAMIVALLVTTMLFLPDYLVARDMGGRSRQVAPLELAQARNDIRTTLLQLVVGLFVLTGAGLGAWVGLHQVRTTGKGIQDNTEQTSAQLRILAEGQITERFTRAVEHLGSERLEIRLGGIYALERIAHNSPVDRPTVREILVAYLRTHAPWPPLEGYGATVQPTTSASQVDATSNVSAGVSPLEIRAPDVQAVIDVLCRLPSGPEPFPLRLERLDLRGVRIGIATHKGTVFPARLHLVSLEGANLRGAKLAGIELRKANLRNTDLDGADLHWADLEEADLVDASLRGADLIRAKLGRANLAGADLTGANLIHADLTRTQLHLATLERAVLREAELKGATLTVAKANGALLPGANLEGARLYKAHFKGAIFNDTNLKAADLSYAELEGVPLNGVNWESTVLRRANLSGATIDNGADLRGKDLSGVSFEGADLSRANLEGANLSEANLRNSHLVAANLRGVKLDDADLSMSDLRAAKLDGTDLTKARSVHGARILRGWFTLPDGVEPTQLGIEVEDPPTLA
jgi:uncharacterized protein YjbI with pentapeptide repeats